MIKTAMVAMSVLGCDCDAKLCQFVSETPAQWSSVSDCEAAAKSRIVKNSKLDYPLVSVECRVVGEQAPIIQAAAQEPTQDIASTAPQAASPAPAIDAVTTAAIADEPQGWGSALYGVASHGSQTIYRKTAGGYQMLASGLGSAADGALALARKSAGYVWAQ